MKFLLISTLHPAHYWIYARKFYARNPDLRNRSYNEQKAAWDYEAIGWADYYSNALRPLGYEAIEILGTIEPLQKKWAQENGFRYHSDRWAAEIAFEQIKRYGPDVLFIEDYHYFGKQWIHELRQCCPAIRLVLGYVDSAFPDFGTWRYSDLILSSGPEATARLKDQGQRVEQLFYAFDSRILDRIDKTQKAKDIVFIGQLARTLSHHTERERLLVSLLEQMPVRIFSPSADYGIREDLLHVLRCSAYSVAQIFRKMGLPQSVLQAAPLLNRAARWETRPLHPVSRKLKRLLEPPVYGLEMFQTLQSSRVVFNAHINSSPTHASNYRLFEATGAGSCLLTDWKQNLAELFEPDKEIIPYRSAEECIEKAKWLLEHPNERESIAAAGQARTLKDHTFTHRASQLDEIIRRNL